MELCGLSSQKDATNLMTGLMNRFKKSERCLMLRTWVLELPNRRFRAIIYSRWYFLKWVQSELNVRLIQCIVVRVSKSKNLVNVQTFYGIFWVCSACCSKSISGKINLLMITDWSLLTLPGTKIFLEKTRFLLSVFGCNFKRKSTEVWLCFSILNFMFYHVKFFIW